MTLVGHGGGNNCVDVEKIARDFAEAMDEIESGEDARNQADTLEPSNIELK